MDSKIWAWIRRWACWRAIWRAIWGFRRTRDIRKAHAHIEMHVMRNTTHLRRGWDLEMGNTCRTDAISRIDVWESITSFKAIRTRCFGAIFDLGIVIATIWSCKTSSMIAELERNWDVLVTVKLFISRIEGEPHFAFSWSALCDIKLIAPSIVTWVVIVWLILSSTPVPASCWGKR